jgi:hypothetical protein
MFVMPDSAERRISASYASDPASVWSAQYAWICAVFEPINRGATMLAGLSDRTQPAEVTRI